LLEILNYLNCCAEEVDPLDVPLNLPVYLPLDPSLDVPLSDNRSDSTFRLRYSLPKGFTGETLDVLTESLNRRSRQLAEDRLRQPLEAVDELNENSSPEMDLINEMHFPRRVRNDLRDFLA
jgi:hypothetical protein